MIEKEKNINKGLSCILFFYIDNR